MPAKVRRGGESCPYEVYNPDTDTRWPGGCHDTEAEAERHAAAINANTQDYASEAVPGFQEDHGNIDTPNAADLNTAARRYAASRGWAMSDGSYPVRPADMHGGSDLTSAIRAVGRGSGSHDAIRRHIIKRARAIGKADAVPESWGSSGSMNADDGDVIHFEFPTADAQFRVDRSRRRVSGMIVPWDTVARSGGYEWRFDPGTIEVPAQLDRVKLVRDHDIFRPVGKLMAYEDRDDGAWGDYYIMRGPTGDEVLAAAEDGILDGFSVGPSIPSDAWEYDRAGVRRVFAKVPLVETSITAYPAFDNARVASVVAHRSGGKMADNDKGKGSGDGKGGNDGTTVLDHSDAAMERFEADLEQRFGAITNKLSESFETVTKGLTETHERIVTDALANSFSRLEGPGAQADAEFSRARLQVVSEPPVYRFDSDPRGHSMVRDFWRANTERDHDCIDRLRKFQQQQQDMVKLLQRMPPDIRAQFANVTTTSGAAVIPPGYRPDLFVTELRRNRPLVSLASRGTITDATPFTVPRFVSSTTATADHVEGTNPTDGTLTLESVTVSPGAVSGLFKLTREIVDASNPAIDAIALGTMRESFNRQTEQKAYAALKDQATGILVINVTQAILDAATDTSALKNIRKLLALYPFVRFASPTGAAISQSVTSYMSQIVDTTGRPLLPSVGAQNTAGIGNAVDQGWFVDGLAFQPAWAITESVGDDVTLIVNSADFWVWESPLMTFRFEERSGPALIEMALFAYFATKVLRPAGIAALNKSA
jgi:HK97 family phage major capsid protein/HK97 family phage prohead protease